MPGQPCQAGRFLGQLATGHVIRSLGKPKFRKWLRTLGLISERLAAFGSLGNFSDRRSISNVSRGGKTPALVSHRETVRFVTPSSEASVACDILVPSRNVFRSLARMGTFCPPQFGCQGIRVALLKRGHFVLM